MIESVLARAGSNIADALATVGKYVGVGAVSAVGVGGKDAEKVQELARIVESDLQLLPGRSKVRKHELDGAFPCVSAEWEYGDDLPRVLIYGHGDVQPADPSDWRTPPFQGVVRRGPGGERLYGRGSADDIGGWMSHVVAISSWLECHPKLPVNVRLFIEFEEEIGSPNLIAHMDAIEAQLPGFFDVDAMVLTDCENPSLEVPGFTRSLRGIAQADVRCRTFDSSGVDPSIALCSLISRLLDPRDGRPSFGLVEDISDAELRELAETPHEAGDLPKRDGRSDAEWAWRQPALTVTAASLPSTTGAKETNCIRPQVTFLLSHPDAESVRKGVDRGLATSVLLPEIALLPGIAFSTRRISSTEVEVQCSTGRKADGHSGLKGSVWSDPSCLMLLWIDRVLGDAHWARRMSVKATSLPAIADPSSVADVVCMRLSIRVPPGSTADGELDEVERRIIEDAMARGVGVELKRRMAGHGGAWLYEVPDCAAFDAADRAYEAVWGKMPARIGVGGSIPFIQMFAERYQATTALILNGVLDPESALHAPNESLHLALFEKAVLTNVRLLYEFGKLPKGGFLSKAQ